MAPKTSANFNFFMLFISTTIIALLLMIIPLPSWLFYFRPDWVALILVYWALAMPTQVGVIAGFILGLIMDVMLVKTFGLHALGLSFIGFVISSAHLQIRMLSIWQQSLIVGTLLAFTKLITGWITGMVTDFTITQYYWYSLLGDMIIWPWLFIILSELRRALRVR